MKSEKMISLAQLERIRELFFLGKVLGDDNLSDRRAREAGEEARKILEDFSDMACSHDFMQFGPILKRCRVCHTTRCIEHENNNSSEVEEE